jgi:four helix bundle protein
MIVRRYQDLDCWQLANELKKEIYSLLSETPNAQRDFGCSGQLKDAASSGPANLAEGFAYYRHKKAARFVRIAKGSLTETRNHIEDGCDRNYWSADRAAPLRTLADRAIGATTGWLGYLLSSKEP